MFNWPILIAVGACCLLVGVAVGALLSKLFTPENRNIRELEKRLADSGTDIKNYRQDVSDHYVKTATLVDELTESYRELHNHLAEGASDLLDARGLEPLIRAIPSRERIEAISDPHHQSVMPPLDYAPKTSPGEKGVLDESFGLDKPPRAQARISDPMDEFFHDRSSTNEHRSRPRRRY